MYFDENNYFFRPATLGQPVLVTDLGGLKVSVGKFQMCTFVIGILKGVDWPGIVIVESELFECMLFLWVPLRA